MPRLSSIGLAPAATLRMTFVDDGLGEHGRGGGAVAGDIVGLGRGFLQKLRAHVLEGVFEFDFLGDGHAVVGDGRGAELLVQRDVAALGAKGGLDRIGQNIDTLFERLSSLLIEFNHFCHSKILRVYVDE